MLNDTVNSLVSSYFIYLVSNCHGMAWHGMIYYFEAKVELENAVGDFFIFYNSIITINSHRRLACDNLFRRSH